VRPDCAARSGCASACGPVAAPRRPAKPTRLARARQGLTRPEWARQGQVPSARDRPADVRPGRVRPGRIRARLVRPGGVRDGGVRARLVRPARDGRRQSAPHPRPPPGRAPRQPLLSGPRSSPFHHVLTLLPCRCPTGHPGSPLPPGAVAHVTIIPRQIHPPVTDIAESLLVTTVLPRSRVTCCGHYVPTGQSTHQDGRKKGRRA
jgi:hypothetical protein